MPEAERRARLSALADRLLDPDGFDWETLANLEELTTRIHPPEEQARISSSGSSVSTTARTECAGDLPTPPEPGVDIGWVDGLGGVRLLE